MRSFVLTTCCRDTKTIRLLRDCFVSFVFFDPIMVAAILCHSYYRFFFVCLSAHPPLHSVVIIQHNTFQFNTNTNTNTNSNSKFCAQCKYQVTKVMSQIGCCLGGAAIISDNSTALSLLLALLSFSSLSALLLVLFCIVLFCRVLSYRIVLYCFCVLMLGIMSPIQSNPIQ